MLLAFSLLFFIAILISGCAEKNPQHWLITGYTMGTSYHITVTAPSQLGELSRTDLEALIRQKLKLINQQMSTYIDDSELSVFNRAPINTDVPVSAPLAYMIERSLQIYHQTDHSFDPTIGALVNLWGFGPENQPERVPSQQRIDQLLAIHGMDKVQVDTANNTLRKTSSVYVDLSAIAKGDGVDRLAVLLDELGVTDYLVEIGGELRSRGLNPRGSAWRVAIEVPSDGLSEVVLQAVSIADMSIATSGDYRNYFEKDGVRYSHTIDPRTGYPVGHTLASVTVITASSGDADAYATAITVLGAEQGMALAEEINLPVLMVVRSINGFETIKSTAFAPYIESK
ncbi:FAD:protein FMN transferase [Sinobacterium norvegicum]|uniref:FAD:protein FMN transferase n=2 Tax=Sinobacterium norvegicum TaxID=1641715 RepID=A0ABN8EEG0_9GAMM|nr:FAD:protein FMN transferase [Sinobacterium norvegicum]